MRISLRARIATLPALALPAFLVGPAHAQTNLGANTIAPAVAGRLAEQPASAGDTETAKFVYFETLGEKGWDIPRPGTAETIVGDTGGIRSKLAEYGIGFLGLGSYTLAVDTLHQQGGVQYYNGQRPTFNSTTQFSVSLNLAQYGVPGGQITAAMANASTSWAPLGPRATSLLRLWYYQEFFGGRLAFKAGYLVEPVEFYGTFVGGNIVSGTLGPNANLLNQVGISRSPLTAPGANFRFNGPNNLYIKSGIQRSTTPAGAQAEHDFNPTGFRFRTPNTRALFINEVGYQRPASPSDRSLWIRGGALYNTSPYTVFGTPRTTPNYAVIGLADLQLIKTDKAFPARGIYGGLTYISGDANVDATSRYYEARLYGIGVVPGRPLDFLSFVYTNTQFSGQSQALLRSQGVPAFAAINNVTGSYSAHLARGVFLINGLTYGDHASATPIGRSALVFSSTLSIVF